MCDFEARRMPDVLDVMTETGRLKLEGSQWTLEDLDATLTDVAVRLETAATRSRHKCEMSDLNKRLGIEADGETEQHRSLVEEIEQAMNAVLDLQEKVERLTIAQRRQKP